MLLKSLWEQQLFGSPLCILYCNIFIVYSGYIFFQLHRNQFKFSTKHIMATMRHPCLVYKAEVSPCQEAIQYTLWQHRTCNSGITRNFYRNLNKGQVELPEWFYYICTRRRNDPSEDTTPVSPSSSLSHPRSSNPRSRLRAQAISQVKTAARNDLFKSSGKIVSDTLLTLVTDAICILHIFWWRIQTRHMVHSVWCI